MALRPQTIKIGRVTFTYNTCTWNMQAIFAGEEKIQIGTQYDFNITGILKAATPAQLKALMVSIRQQLSLPLYLDDTTINPFFKIQIGTDVVFLVDRKDCDDTSPVLGTVTFDNFVAGLSCRYNMTVSIFKKEVLNGDGSYAEPGKADWPGVVQISKNINFEYDTSGMCVRTVSGVLMTTARKAADVYREKIVAIFPPPVNFQRIKQQFACSYDSRRLDFIIVDKELVNVFPKPITEGSCNYEVTCEGNAIVFGKLSGWFSCPISADNNSDKRLVITRIIELVNIKFNLSRQSCVWKNISISEDLYNSNRIDFAFEGQIAQITGIATAQKVTVPNLKPFLTLGALATDAGHYPSTRSNSDLKDMHCLYWYDGIKGVYKPLSITPATKTSSTLSDRATDKPIFQSSQYKPDDGSGLSTEENLKNPYLYWTEIYSYETKTNIKTFYTMTTNRNTPVFQETCQPNVYLIQAGTATRHGIPPVIPPPIYHFSSTPKAAILYSYVSPVSRNYDATGNPIFTKSWRYVIEVDSSVFDYKDSVKLNADPRIKDSAVYKFDNKYIDMKLSINNLVDFPK